MFLGQWLYPTGKPRGDSSMPLKRVLPEGAVGQVPRDPRDMVKAGLLEPQSPDGVAGRPPVERLQPGAAHCISRKSWLTQPPMCGRWAMSPSKGMSGAPTSR
jgi:hypothetical protein